MTAPAPSKCKTCPALIHWAKTERGATAPIDVATAEDGQFYLVREAGEVLALHVNSPRVAADPQRFATAPKHHNHFVTCPSREQHRRKKT